MNVGLDFFVSLLFGSGIVVIGCCFVWVVILLDVVVMGFVYGFFVMGVLFFVLLFVFFV